MRPGKLPRDESGKVVDAAADAMPNPTSREVLALAAYLNWLSRGNEIGKSPAWRGQNTIAQASLIPVDKLDPQKGEAIYKERCVSCHGAEGQGVFVGDKRPGPLWGPELVERWRRSGARLHAGGDHSLHDAVPRSRQHDRRGRAATRGVHQRRSRDRPTRSRIRITG